MQAPHHPIFRDRALKHYMQSQRKDVLPHFSSIPVAIFLWVLLGLLIATGFMAWYIQIPVYLNGTGIVLSAKTQPLSTRDKAVALAFFQPGTTSGLQAGQTAKIQSSVTGSQQTSVILQVEPGVSSPTTIQNRYGVQVGQPVVVAFIDLGKNFPALYANSTLVVQVHIRTESLFSALTGIGKTGE